MGGMNNTFDKQKPSPMCIKYLSLVYTKANALKV